MKLAIIISILSLSFLANATQPENVFYPRLHKVDITKGLSQNVILSAVLDSAGFYWAGTMDGLNKFDGQNFEIYRKELIVDESHRDDRIHKIWIDHLNKLWLVKTDGTYRMGLNDKKAERVRIDDINPVIYAPKNKDSYWLTNSHLNIYAVNAETLEYEKLNEAGKNLLQKNQDRIHSIFLSSDDEFTAVTLKAAALIYKNGEFEYIPNTVIENPNNVISTDIDEDNNIWMCSYQGFLCQFNPREKSFKDIGKIYFDFEKNKKFNHLYHDSTANCMWISCSRNGLFSYDYTDGTLDKYVIRAPNSKILDSENILNVIRDPHSKVLYLGTDQHGILCLDPYLNKFDFIDSERLKKNDLDFRLPRKLASDNYGNIWVGSVNTGLWKFDQQAQTLESYNRQNHPELMIDNSSVQLLHQNDTLWVGHNGNGVSKFLLPNMQKLDHFTMNEIDPERRIENIIWNLKKDRHEGLWIGTRTAGVFYKTSKGLREFSMYTKDLGDNAIYTITEDKNGDIIIITQKTGIYKYSFDSDSIRHIFPKEGDPLNITCKSLLFDNELIWLATEGKGVLILDEDYNVIQQIDTENKQLNNNSVCSILQDSDYTIWASTNSGLHRIEYFPNNEKVITKVYTIKDGLLSNEFMTGAYLKTDSLLWFGNMEGVNYFNPKQLSINKNAPRSYIRSIYVNDSIVNINQLKKLHHKQDNISFDFNTIGFTLADETKYSYRLLGYDSTWCKPTTRNFSRYTNLKPGDYTFELTAVNYDGIWNKNPISTSFTIKPAYWQTNWFRILLLLSLLLLFYLLYKLRINSIKRQERLKNEFSKELTEMEMKALRAQINPHFLFNTLNSINSYILQKDNTTASHYLVKFSKLMRMILSNSSTSFIKLEDELKALDLYIEMESMRFGNSFDYFLNVENEIMLDQVMIPPMLLQPFVENAIWHGLMHKDGDKVLELNINSIEEFINISIKDNGIGREAASKLKKEGKRKSFGMDITRKRIIMINEELAEDDTKSSIEIIDLHDKKGNATGTEIKILIPNVASNKNLINA